MAKNFFKRYIWLVDLLSRRGYISLREISDEWQKSPLNDTHAPLSERTFFNHRDAIFDIFGIEIRNDRALGFYIASSDMDGNSTGEWMLHTLCLNNVLQENADMKNRILVEKAPLSEKFLTEVISAMRAGKVISLTYQSFYRPEPSTFCVRPYCVKYFKKRWYMLADSDLSLRIYSLDRFVDMEELDQTFEIPEEFDAEGFFSNYFGVIVGDKKAEDVVIRVEPSQANYFRSAPKHHSQKEIEPIDGWPAFTYHIAPTYDFKQEILSHGAFVEVISPEWFRNAVSGDIAEMASKYGLSTSNLTGDDNLPYFSEEDEYEL
ncbi:MAG: WYL domain-containing protein [Candidatus Cryptobacteroides sp.]|nr:WYL domain-containing protein [Candidatus Cryptobacteroides sp.]